MKSEVQVECDPNAMMYKTEGWSELRKRINAAEWPSFDVNAVAFCQRAPESHQRSCPVVTISLKFDKICQLYYRRGWAGYDKLCYVPHFFDVARFPMISAEDADGPILSLAH